MLRNFCALVWGVVEWVRLHAHGLCMHLKGVAQAARYTFPSLLVHALTEVVVVSVQRAWICVEHGIAAGVVTTELGQHNHVEGVPVRDEFFLSSE